MSRGAFISRWIVISRRSVSWPRSNGSCAKAARRFSGRPKSPAGKRRVRALQRPSPRPERVQGIIEAVTRYLPEFRAEDFRDVAPWRGLRPCSPDGLPYVGRFRRYENLSTATGHAMMGLSLGPITGRLMTEILSGEKPS